MKLTMDEVVAKMSAAWESRAAVVPSRISGNRYVYAVTDHGEHWVPLDTSWVHGRQVFEPAEGSWPVPNPVTDSWLQAVKEGSRLVIERCSPARRLSSPMWAGPLAMARSWPASMASRPCWVQVWRPSAFLVARL